MMEDGSLNMLTTAAELRRLKCSRPSRYPRVATLRRAAALSSTAFPPRPSPELRVPLNEAASQEDLRPNSQRVLAKVQKLYCTFDIPGFSAPAHNDRDG